MTRKQLARVRGVLTAAANNQYRGFTREELRSAGHLTWVLNLPADTFAWSDIEPHYDIVRAARDRQTP